MSIVDLFDAIMSTRPWGSAQYAERAHVELVQEVERGDRSSRFGAAAPRGR